MLGNYPDLFIGVLPIDQASILVSGNFPQDFFDIQQGRRELVSVCVLFSLIKHCPQRWLAVGC